MSASAVRPRRLFFALWPDGATREALHHATRAAVRDSGGKPVRPEDFHLTLAFLGNVPEERVDAIIGAARALALEPLTLRLDCFGWFEAVHVLWIGPAVVPAPLGRLASDLSGCGRGLSPDCTNQDLSSSHNHFHPHVTLARNVAAPREIAAPRPVDWPVAGFSLLESTTGPKGVRYRVVADWPTATVEGREPPTN